MTEPSIWSSSRRTGGRPAGGGDTRRPFEQDYDRLLFSGPIYVLDPTVREG